MGWIKHSVYGFLFWLLFFTLAAGTPRLGAEQFFYKHEAGDKYRILSTVREDVYLDRRLNHRAEILNRIVVEVTGIQDGMARHEALFQTAERAEGVNGGGSFQWVREYGSEFGRDSAGYITIDKTYYMPVVRNVPVFPNRNLVPGETWTADGHEAHDFRDSFGIPEPYHIPFTAHYTFLGSREWQGREYPAFSISYRIFIEPDAVSGNLYPRRIMGASDQTLYWDPALGQAAAYEENFRMVFELSNGRTVEYRGTAQAEIVESAVMDKDKIAGEIAGDITRMGIEGATVRVAEKGITISLENIQFQPDSAVLLSGEQEKLDKIAEILQRYPDRDILVGGHTALAGSQAGQLALSQERAAAVADYLIGKQVRTPDRVMVRGYGAENPLADNATEAGRQRNRRVEITILED
ncbi:MAG: OmpA family protein [Treponema sp.]|jgi:outer membrane protein OmpA-like peptidoglycan-associated protein|nr:OmpA family protein [Treponema sp.]